MFQSQIHSFYLCKDTAHSMINEINGINANDNQGNRVSHNTVVVIGPNQVENCFSFLAGMTMLFLEFCLLKHSRKLTLIYNDEF